MIIKNLLTNTIVRPGLWGALRKKRFFIVLISVIIFFSIYLFTIYQRSDKLFAYLKTEKKRGWKGIPHKADDTLGFAPLPNARAFHTFPIGPDIPMAYSKNGFRIPLNDTANDHIQNKVGLLFLGCSFTYGDACLAEETFPYLVAQKTQLTYINAGVCGYGLSQMLILAERLIPEYKPQYVIVQHSPWLADRSLSYFAPVYFGSAPTPYFMMKNDKINVHLPIYRTQLFDYDMDWERIKKIKSSFLFFINTGLHFYFKEDWLKVISDIKLFLNIYEKPANDPVKAELFAYSRIIEVASANNSQVIILSLYTKDESAHLIKQLSQRNVLYANADSLLRANLKRSGSDSFEREYGQWRLEGADSVEVDSHPNPLAHRIISKSIIEIIK